MNFQEKISHAKQVIDTVRQVSNRALLFYSAGKDSICLLDMLSKSFDEVVCVFMYFVADLEHINRFIRFSEAKYNNVKFIQVPHWTLTKIHSSGLFCQPRKVRQLEFADVINTMKRQTGIEWAFIGEKKADNMVRRIKLRQYELEAIYRPTTNAYPLSNWKDAEVLDYNKRNKLPQAISYGTKKRSNGVGFDLNVYLFLRQFYPDDLKKILAAFPASEKLLFDYDLKQKKDGKKND